MGSQHENAKGHYGLARIGPSPRDSPGFYAHLFCRAAHFCSGIGMACFTVACRLRRWHQTYSPVQESKMRPIVDPIIIHSMFQKPRPPEPSERQSVSRAKAVVRNRRQLIITYVADLCEPEQKNSSKVIQNGIATKNGIV